MAKFTGRGAVLAVLTVDSPETWQDVAQIRSIGGISMTSDEVEVTTLDDLGDFRSFIQGFRDAGEMAVELIWDPSLASHGPATYGAYGLFTSGLNIVLRETVPVSPLHYIFIQGFIRDFELPTMTVDDPVAVTETIRLSSIPILSTTATNPF
jgi:hypothetical protein